MQIWYNDNEISISFDNIPQVEARVILPDMEYGEKMSITLFPFAWKKETDIEIIDKINNIIYGFTIPENTYWNGADIPRLFWRIIGSPTDNKFLVASVIHDFLCLNKDEIDYDRELSSKVFRALLISAGVSERKANIMYFAVDLFQKLKGGWNG